MPWRAGDGRAIDLELPAGLSRLVPPTSATCATRAAGKTLGRFLAEKALVAVALPLVPLLPTRPRPDACRRPGSCSSSRSPGFAPDLVLRSEVKRRREAIFLDLPEAIPVLALALGAGQSLRLALELAARDCPGPLGEELTRALSLARRTARLASARHSSGSPARRASRLRPLR